MQYGVDQVAHAAPVCRHLQLMRFVVRCQLIQISLAPWAHLQSNRLWSWFLSFPLCTPQFPCCSCNSLDRLGVFAFWPLEPFFILIWCGAMHAHYADADTLNIKSIPNTWAHTINKRFHELPSKTLSFRISFRFFLWTKEYHIRMALCAVAAAAFAATAAMRMPAEVATYHTHAPESQRI